MLIRFEKEYLRELYETGKCSDKKHRFQPEVIKAYARCIYRLEEAASIETLYRLHSLNYEILTGYKKGISSVRVNNRYRIEFTISQSDAEPIITVCNILELSNHYK